MVPLGVPKAMVDTGTPASTWRPWRRPRWVGRSVVLPSDISTMRAGAGVPWSSEGTDEMASSAGEDGLTDGGALAELEAVDALLQPVVVGGRRRP